MGRHNKATKESKAKAREEREAKAREEKKLLEPSNTAVEPSTVSVAAEVFATNSASCLSSPQTSQTSIEAKSKALELVRGSEDEGSQENVRVNGTPNGFCLVNESGKESVPANEANAEAIKMEKAQGGWPQLAKGGDVRKSGEASSVFRLEPSKFEARQNARVEGSNPVENKVNGVGYSAQPQSGDFRTAGNGRGGGYGHQGSRRVEGSNPSVQSHWGGSGNFRTAGNGRGGVRGDYGHQASASGVDDYTRIDSLGRSFSSILRHRAIELGLNMRSDGYVLVNDLLKLRLRTSAGLPLSSHTVDDVKEVVRVDNKQRFGLREENGQLLIRANQGHSIQTIKSEDLLSTVSSVEEVPDQISYIADGLCKAVCVHGTYLKNLDAIKKEGLKRMKRNHVHFAPGLSKERGVISGMRSNCQVLIHLDVQKYLKDGMKLYRSENGVILAEGKNGVIPLDYFAKIELVRS